jgi:hypothetical protein
VALNNTGCATRRPYYSGAALSHQYSLFILLHRFRYSAVYLFRDLSLMKDKINTDPGVVPVGTRLS